MTTLTAIPTEKLLELISLLPPASEAESGVVVPFFSEQSGMYALHFSLFTDKEGKKQWALNLQNDKSLSR